jgi:hypothetical protein
MMKRWVDRCSSISTFSANHLANAGAPDRDERRLRTDGRSAFPPLASSTPSTDFLTLCGAISQFGGDAMPFP